MSIGELGFVDPVSSSLNPELPPPLLLIVFSKLNFDGARNRVAVRSLVFRLLENCAWRAGRYGTGSVHSHNYIPCSATLRLLLPCPIVALTLRLFVLILDVPNKQGGDQQTDIETPGQLKPGQVLPFDQIPSPRPLSTAPTHGRSCGPLATSRSAGQSMMIHSTESDRKDTFLVENLRFTQMQ